MTFVRMLLVIFSHKIRHELFACFPKTFARLSQNCGIVNGFENILAKKFA